LRCQPAGELHVVGGVGAQLGVGLLGALQHAGGQRRRHEGGGHAVVLFLRDGVRRAVVLEDLLVLGFHVVDVALAFGLHQDLDARLVDVVAAAVAVVDPDHRFEVIHDLLPRQELAQHGADDGRAAHAAAHLHAEAEFAGLVLHHMQAHVVPAGGGAVFGGAGDGDLELARQEGELGVQRAPLAHDFREGARIGDFVDGNAGALVAGDVADAVAAGLDAVHVDRGQQVHHVGRLGQRNPVVLHVLARREVGVVGGQLVAAEQALRFDGLR
jgi:hypothetical protein